jgi:hypothetical protein
MSESATIEELTNSLDSMTRKKAKILIDKGLEVTGVVLTNKATGDKCAVNMGRVNWASVSPEKLDIEADQP